MSLMPKYIFNKDTLTYEVYASSGKLKFIFSIVLENTGTAMTVMNI